MFPSFVISLLLFNYFNTLVCFKVLNIFKQIFNLPVRSDASAMRKVLYDIRTNKADSKSGKSRTLVNFVSNAVMHPMVAPINSDRLNIPTKSPRARKKAKVSNPPDTDCER